MTDKKHESKEAMPVQGGGQAEGQSDPHDEGARDKAVTQSVSVEEVELLTSQLAQAEARAAEYLEGWQRAQAEFANYKRRLERDNAAFREIARGDVIKRFLPVVDDLERALANRPSDEHAWVGGIELVYRKLIGILSPRASNASRPKAKPLTPTCTRPYRRSITRISRAVR
jgi:molecular chaperone GrpE